MKKIMVIAICLCMVVLLCSCSQEPQGIGETGISLDEFNRLYLDSTYKTACEIIGGEGQIISESESDEEEYIRITTVYRFEGETGGYADLEFTFFSYKELLKADSNRYLTRKTQYNLK